jgi:hypothetical protein
MTAPLHLLDRTRWHNFQNGNIAKVGLLEQTPGYPAFRRLKALP